MEGSSYYDRERIAHLDGTAVFQTQADQDAEREVAAEVEAAWHVTLGRFGALAPVDWYATRNGRVVGVAELKARTHEIAKYPTVFLNVRKWLALQLAAVGLGVPAVFVVRFTDGLRWVPIAGIDATCHRVAGCARLVKSVNDIEPVIEVPIADLRTMRFEPNGGQP